MKKCTLNFIRNETLIETYFINNINYRFVNEMLIGCRYRVLRKIWHKYTSYRARIFCNLLPSLYNKSADEFKFIQCM